MNEETTNEWKIENLGESLVSLPKSKHPSGISDENGYYNFYVCSKEINKSFQYDMKEPSVLFSTGGEAAVHYANGKYSYSTDVWATKFTGNITNEFIYRFLELNIKKLNNLGFQGSGIKHLDKNYLKKLLIRFPPLNEQKKIASILNSVEEVIETTQKKIDKLQDLKKATMHKLLTKGIGHTDFKESEFGRIPKNWEVKRLQDLSNIFFSNVDKKSNKNEISVFLCNYMDVYINRNIKKNMKFMEATAKQSEIEKFLILKGDVMITKDSETPNDIAVPSYVSEDLINVLCGYHLALIRSQKTKLSGKFLFYLFSLKSIQHRYFKLANGSTRFGLTANVIKETPLPIPSLGEQNKIASILNSIDEQIDNKERKLEKYQSLKKSLMQDLLTGKVRVKVN